MTDTHTHLYLSDFEDGGVEAVERALKAGVSAFVFPNVDVSTLEPMRKLHHAFPGRTRMAIGLHPTEVGDDWEEIVARMENYLDSGEFAAIGEVGMDLYWDQTRKEQQKQAFRRQLEIADKYNLPVIIHNRDATDETLEAIRETNPSVPLIFHSFTLGKDAVRKIREVCNPYFGINGVVTYKNAAALREALPEIGIDRIILETDSPYLTPVPHRGKRNESAYLPFINVKIAETLGLTPEEVEKTTDTSAFNLFFR